MILMIALLRQIEKNRSNQTESGAMNYWENMLSLLQWIDSIHSISSSRYLLKVAPDPTHLTAEGEGQPLERMQWVGLHCESD
jgi:hypothetical protein